MQRFLRVLVSSALATLLSASPGLGHAELRSAEPGPDDTIVEVPDELVARFTQDLHRERSSIEVRDARGETIARGGAVREGGRVQAVVLPPLEPGRYEVRWVTFSAEDDEIARGRYQFSVEVPPATPAPPSPVAHPSAAAEASPAGPGASAPATSLPLVLFDVIALGLLEALGGTIGDADPATEASPST